MKLETFYKSAVFGFAILSASVAMAFELTPKKAGVVMRAQPAANAAILKTLTGTEKLTVVAKSGTFWNVTLDGQKGFVLASEVQPARNSDSASTSGFKSVINGSNKEGGQKQRSRTAVMGIRGLDDAEDVSNKSERNNPNATEKMEKRNISKDAVNRIEDSVNKENEQLQNQNK